MIYDQRKGSRFNFSTGKAVAKLVVFLGSVILISFTLALFIAQMVGAAGWSPRTGCDYTIEGGDTLTAISTARSVSISDLVQVNPSIHNPNLIIEGADMDICHPDVISGDRPVLVEPEVPYAVRRWAEQVSATAPAWATPGNIRLLVALAGPESNWCTATVNNGDANPPRWGPSVGCVQTRTFLRASDLTKEPWRDRAWLEEGKRNQAESAWIILGAQGHTAWGPRTDGKLPDNCNNSSVPKQCRGWWALADRALAM